VERVPPVKPGLLVKQVKPAPRVPPVKPDLLVKRVKPVPRVPQVKPDLLVKRVKPAPRVPPVKQVQPVKRVKLVPRARPAPQVLPVKLDQRVVQVPQVPKVTRAFRVTPGEPEKSVLLVKAFVFLRPLTTIVPFQSRAIQARLLANSSWCEVGAFIYLWVRMVVATLDRTTCIGL
jgi:hypothetical protein